MSNSFEYFMAEIFTSPNYKPKPPGNPLESEEYAKFVEEMAKECRCEYDQPCDGLLCGGPCDHRKKVDPLPDFDDPDEEKWAGDE